MRWKWSIIDGLFGIIFLVLFFNLISRISILENKCNELVAAHNRILIGLKLLPIDDLKK